MKATDQSGYVVFSNGDIGQAHVMAHRLLDSGQIESGRKRLSAWLDGQTGSGSDWAHIQFHMAVFELETGDWNSAYVRFINEVLPIAATSDDALTDAPALAWRLGLRSNHEPALGWDALRQTAIKSLDKENDAFVELHNLLALAGAGDRESIDNWLRRRGKSASSGLIVRFGEALRDYTQASYQRAAAILKEIVPEVPAIGGSRAQNQLFSEMQSRMAVA